MYAFIGYTEDYATDYYQIWEAITYNIYMTRDIIWLKRIYYSNNESTNHEPIWTIDIPISEAGEREVNKTLETEMQIDAK